MVSWDAIMPEEGVIIEESDLINEGCIILAKPNERPENKVSSGCGD
jgi:hypothetical protein